MGGTIASKRDLWQCELPSTVKTTWANDDFSILFDQEMTSETCPSGSFIDQIISSSPLETRKIGALLGQSIIGKREKASHPSQSVVIGLMGELGAGKTTFTQGLARGLGIQARITSPTFTLINQYTTPTEDVRLFHVDSYRLVAEPAAGRAGRDESLANQVYGLGMDELFDAVEEESTPHIVVIEWADRLVDLLPDDRLMIRFGSRADRQTQVAREVTGDRDSERMLSFCATGPHSGALLAALRTAEARVGVPLGH